MSNHRNNTAINAMLCDATEDENMSNQTEKMENVNREQEKKIFRSNNIIPNVSDDSSDEMANGSNVKPTYHCVTTKDSKPREGMSSKVETINTIIKRLDQQVEPKQDNMEGYVTKESMTDMLTEMRMDFLNIINLVSALNANVTSDNKEIHKVKEDIYKLVQENELLKAKISKNKEESQKRCDRIANMYEEEINNLNQDIKTLMDDTDHLKKLNSPMTNISEGKTQSSLKTGNLKVVGKRGTRDAVKTISIPNEARKVNSVELLQKANSVELLQKANSVELLQNINKVDTEAEKDIKNANESLAVKRIHAMEYRKKIEREGKQIALPAGAIVETIKEEEPRIITQTSRQSSRINKTEDELNSKVSSRQKYNKSFKGLADTIQNSSGKNAPSNVTRKIATQ